MTITASMLPGLLSRVGPSLYSPAWTVQAESIPSFSTNSFLDAFEPDPVTGDLQVAALKPGSKDSPYDGAMWISRLTVDGTLPGFRRSADGILRDALQIQKAHDRWNYSAPYTLPHTRNHWQIYDLIPGEERDSKALVNLRSKDYREIVADMRSGNSVTFMAGWHGPESSLQQAIAVDEAQRVFTRGYSFSFLESALNHLGSYLGLEGVPLVEIVAQVASRIYFSGQYTLKRGEGPQIRYGQDTAWFDLDVVGERLRFPADKVPRDSDSFEIRLSKEATRADQWQEIPETSARLIWEPGTDLGYLRIYLGRCPEQSSALMPLVPSLRDMLWDGAWLALYAARD